MPTIRTRSAPAADPEVVTRTLVGACRGLKPMTGEEVEAFLHGVLASLAAQDIIEVPTVNKDYSNKAFTLTWRMVNDQKGEVYMTSIATTII